MMLSTKLGMLARAPVRQCVGARGFATAKEIAFGTEARASMLRGVDMLADAVQTTLGPKVSRALFSCPFATREVVLPEPAREAWRMCT